jgi:hypothetical protein
MRAVKRTVAAAFLMAVAGWAGSAAVSAQATRTELQGPQAHDVRQEFKQLLEQFPPALGVVLKSDPTLLTNLAYLASYPALAKYLTTHPEIARDPSYFLEHVELVQYVDYRSGRRSAGPITAEEQARLAAVDMWRNIMDSFLFLVGFVAAALSIIWVVRYLVEHRRWLRATRIQSDAHNKLLERFASGPELAAYMESPAGARFLAAAPLALESTAKRSPGAPFSRILWSAQAGVVLIAAGIGFLLIQRRMVYDEVQQMIGAWGTLAIAVGVGFLISGAMSYVLSSKMGLLGESRE